MINFRFHMVSLIAIFLALALGVVIGAGVIDRGVVDALDSRLNKVESRSDRIKSDNDRLSAENQQLSNVIGDLQPFAVSGRLLTDTVGVVAVRGVSDNQVKATSTAAQQAGATVSGTIWLESKWNLASSDDLKALQTAVGATTRNKTSLRDEGLKMLAERLKPSAAAGTSGGNGDLLTQLQQQGFIGFDAVDGSSITDFPGPDAGIVLVVGTTGSIPAENVVIPTATALHAASVPVVVADEWVETTDGPARATALQPLRSSDLARTVSTVDDLDLPQGPTTVVLAMSDLFDVPPTVGHYGYGPDAQPLPDPVGS